MNTLIIFAKYPEPGKVKTRLGATIGMEPAAEFYRLFVEQTIKFVAKSNFDRRILYFEPVNQRPYFLEMAPPGFELMTQPIGGLGAKLTHAFANAFISGASNVVAIGTDSPTLPPACLESARTELNNHNVVLGPASDGGYYLIGLSALFEQLFENIQWSSDTVLADTVAMAGQMNLKYSLLSTWYDVDDFVTLKQAVTDDVSGEIKTMFRKHNLQAVK